MQTTIVTLNVGGCCYQTSKETMEMHDNYFRALIKSYEDWSEEQIIFIDRDPSYFKYILNWLRGVKILPEDCISLQELMYEADFYCMEDMKVEIKKHMNTSTTLLTELKQFSSELKYSYH